LEQVEENGTGLGSGAASEMRREAAMFDPTERDRELARIREKIRRTTRDIIRTSKEEMHKARLRTGPSKDSTKTTG
jgi:hypothetical protein